MSRQFAERNVMEYWTRAAASVRLDVGRPDHLAPLLGLLGNVFAEVGGRAWKHSATKVAKARLHLGIVESRVDLLVELVDDFGRRGLRCAEAVPNTPLVARQERYDSKADALPTVTRAGQ